MDDDAQNTGKVPYYAELFSGTSEPSLACAGPFDEAYRIVWSPALDPRRVIIRATRVSSSHRILVLMLTRGGNDGTPAIERSEHELTSQQWESLTAKMSALNVWALPTLPTGPTTLVTDGNNLLLEAHSAGMYHVLAGRPSQRPNEFAEVAGTLFRLGQVDIPDELTQ